LRIVFMGTPAFCIPSLERLLEDAHRVILVVTQPDKPKGRGNRISMPSAKEFALSRNIEVFQPETLKSERVVEILKSYQPDLFVTVAYGKILTKEILEIPKRGTVNVHASLLPLYRGAAPIQWSLIRGERKTGITTMMTDVGLDSGDILLKREMPIDGDMTAGALHDKLSLLGAEVLSQTLQDMTRGRLTQTPQEVDGATYAPMLKKEDGCIDWSKPAQSIHDRVRGMNPFPGAYSFYRGKKIRIWKTKVYEHETLAYTPGAILTASADGLLVATPKGVLHILELQFDSGRRMDVGDYLRGHAMVPGTILGEVEGL
jgi:methionyl-tRNA formyltransferase